MQFIEPLQLGSLEACKCQRSKNWIEKSINECCTACSLFSLYLWFKHRQKQGSQSVPGVIPAASLSVGASLVVASLAGCINVVLTNPIWVLATRMQAGTSGTQRQTIVRAVKEAFEEEGFQWLFKVSTRTLLHAWLVSPWAVTNWVRRKKISMDWAMCSKTYWRRM